MAFILRSGPTASESHDENQSRILQGTDVTNLNILNRELTEINNAYLETFQRICQSHDLPCYAVAGLISRESAWGLSLTPKGPGGTGDTRLRKPKPPFRPDWSPPDGLGYGRGLMQIDYDWHEFARDGKWADAYENVNYGCEILRRFLNVFDGRFQGKQHPDQIRNAIASYNCGYAAVVRSLMESQNADPDKYTSGMNYSADVMARAAWFKEKGLT